MEKSKKEGISRRNFLKITAAWTGALAAGGTGFLYAYEKDKASFFDPERRYPEELRLYGEEGVGTIDKIEKKTNFVVPLPGAIVMENIFSESREDVHNQAWKLEELKTISETIDELPEKLKPTKRIVLGIMRGPYPGFGGGAGDLRGLHVLFLWAPEQYDLEGKSSKPIFWPSLKEELKATFIHELTHLATVPDKKLIREYAELVGWEEKDSKWIFTGQESIVNSFMDERKHDLHEGPEEDIAVSAMFFATNPGLLKDSTNNVDQARLKFVKEKLFID